MRATDRPSSATAPRDTGCWYSGNIRVLWDGKELTAQVLPKGMVLLANPIREQAPETFRYFAEQGVAIKVISGDNPVTVSEVAKEAGIENAHLMWMLLPSIPSTRFWTRWTGIRCSAG